MKTKKLIDHLHECGFDDTQIKNAMLDGVYLDKEKISQEVAEDVYNSL